LQEAQRGELVDGALTGMARARVIRERRNGMPGEVEETGGTSDGPLQR